MNGRLRHMLLDDDAIDKSKSWLRIKGIPETHIGLTQVDAQILEFREQLACRYWTHPLDIMEIKDSLNRATSAFDYLYCVLNKDFSHYNEDGSAGDDDKHYKDGEKRYDYTNFDQVRL